MKKILMMNLTNMAKGEGGALHQLALLQHFKQAGHIVKMLTPARRRSHSVPALMQEAGIWTPELEEWGLPASLDTLLQLPYLIWYRLRWNYTVLYTRANALSFLTVLVGRLLFMKVIVEHNGWMASERIGRGGSSRLAAMEKILQVRAARLAHMNRTVTAGLQRLLVGSGVDKDKTIVIANGTDLSCFYPMRREDALKELGWDPAIRRIGFIGILVPWQGLEVALRAFALLNSRHDVRMVIAGDGPDRARLQKLAAELGIAEEVEFLGRVDHERANLVINGFDIAIAPFTRERNMEIGLSALKIRDYAATGRFVICADIPELLEGDVSDWAQRHEPDNYEDLSRLLQQALKSKPSSKSVQQAARDYAERHFDWKVIASRVLASMDS